MGRLKSKRTCRIAAFLSLSGIAFLHFGFASPQATSGTLSLTILDGGREVPARVEVLDSARAGVVPDDALPVGGD